MAYILKRSNRERCLAMLNKKLDDAKNNRITGIISIDIETHEGGVSNASILTKEIRILDKNRSSDQSG